MKRILIARLSALGDVVCSLPVASALKRAFPESQLVWAVDRRFAGIVRCCGAVDEVWEIVPKGNPLRWPVPEGPFDLALDLQGLLKSALIVGRARAETRLGYHWQREGAAFFSSRVLPDPSSFHIVDQYLDVARAAGAEVHRAEFGLESLEEDRAAMRTLLAESDLTERQFVLLNPGAGWASKRWPAQHIATLIDRLAAQGVRTALLGAAADRAVAEEVLALSTAGPADLTGRTNVRQLVALADLCAVHVGGDTGSSHLAAALGRPAVGLYSITHPRRSCPYGQIERCLYRPEGLAAIEPYSVLACVTAALEASASSGALH